MDCSSVRDHLPSYLGGNLDSADAASVKTHLASCETCRTESNDLQSTRALLHTLPDAPTSPDLWQRLSERLEAEEPIAVAPARKAPNAPTSLRWVKLAAAASILAAAFSFLYVATLKSSVPVATIAYVTPGTALAPGHALLSGDTLTAPAYLEITLADVGTLKVSRDSVLRFDGPRRVELQSGDLFADILPSGRGFEVVAPDATVQVHGTRFGVRTGDAPTTVYVVEGKVGVKTRGGTIALADRQMASVGEPAKALDDERLRWIAESREPRVAMILQNLRRNMKRGDVAEFSLSFQSASPAPVFLERLTDLPARIVLKVTDPAGNEYLASLDGSTTSIQARQDADGRIRVDVSSPVTLHCRVTLERGFDRVGKYWISLSYDGSRTPEGSGTVQPTIPYQIEVRNP